MASFVRNEGPEWLFLLLEPSCNEFRIIDVGAYEGDFTASVLDALPNAKARLFEPTGEKYRQLLERFHDFSEVKVFNMALSNCEGLQEFFQAEDAATNSLLEPCASQSQFNRVQVPIRRLDNLLEQEVSRERIDLIKIDAQGNDFKVLQGAARTIQEHRPLITVECIFIPIYKEQDSYYDILGFMNGNGYRLAGIYNGHVTPLGILAFADLVFVHASRATWAKAASEKKFICDDPKELLNQVGILQSACDERLSLIHRLNEVAEERLKVIQFLDAEVKRLSSRLNTSEA